MKTIIFVCHGSICRSPAAMCIAKDYLSSIHKSDDFKVIAFATSFEEVGNGIYPPMRQELFKNHINLYPHTSQRLTKQDYEKADYVFYMDEENKYGLSRIITDYKNIIKPVFAFSPSINEIEDPWYTGRYYLVVKQLKQCIKDIFDNII